MSNLIVLFIDKMSKKKLTLINFFNNKRLDCMSKKKGANKDNFEHTRTLFLELATLEFNAHGYAKASTSRIVEASGMARGSLYYHFKDKQDLFRAVYEETMLSITTEISQTLEKTSDPWGGFMAASRHYFDLCSTPEKSRIFLIESQAALPYEERHDVISKTLRPVLTKCLTRLMDQGDFKGKNKEMLAIFIFGALGESGRIINVLPNREMVQDHFFDTFRWAMEKMR